MFTEELFGKRTNVHNFAFDILNTCRLCYYDDSVDNTVNSIIVFCYLKSQIPQGIYRCLSIKLA